MSQFFLLFEDKPDITIIDKLVPNLWAFIAQLLAFIVLVLIVFKFAYKPVSNYISKQKNYINSNLEAAKKANEEAEKKNLEATTRVNNSKKEASDILANVKKQAQDDRNKYLSELQVELNNKRQQCEKDIEMQKKQAIIDSQKEVVDLALAASSNLLKKKVDSKTDKKLIQEFIDSINEDK